MELRTATEEERLYTCGQSMQIQGQTGCIGYMEGSFDVSGDGLHTVWSDEWDRYKTEGFEAERDRIMETLQSEEYGLLKDFPSMKKYVRENPQSVFPKENGVLCAFRADTEEHSYLIRCNLSKNGSFQCFCYVRKWLDQHMEKAGRGIRFIDSHYKELFRIKDGEKIVVTSAWGEKREHTCRFIDDYHTEIDRNIYHICEFAERMEQNGAVYEPKHNDAGERKNRNMAR